MQCNAPNGKKKIFAEYRTFIFTIIAPVVRGWWLLYVCHTHSVQAEVSRLKKIKSFYHLSRLLHSNSVDVETVWNWFGNCFSKNGRTDDTTMMIVCLISVVSFHHFAHTHTHDEIFVRFSLSPFVRCVATYFIAFFEFVHSLVVIVVVYLSMSSENQAYILPYTQYNWTRQHVNENARER